MPTDTALTDYVTRFRQLYELQFSKSDPSAELIATLTRGEVERPYFVVYDLSAQVVAYVELLEGRIRAAVMRNEAWVVLGEIPAPEAGPLKVSLRRTGERQIEVALEDGGQVAIEIDVDLSQARRISGVGDWRIREGGVADVGDEADAELTVKKLKRSPPLARTYCPDLIFDVGMHNGSDTDYYLKKGFRVVSVEANPLMAEQGARRFAEWIRLGRLVILNVGVSTSEGQFPFYVNDACTEWSSFNQDIASRGLPTREIKINAVTMGKIFKTFGVPYYLKIDIEGLDGAAAQAACELPQKPRYLSFENGTPHLFEKLVAAGYARFKLLSQRNVMDITLPAPAREGLTIDHIFPYGSSGPFGEETPGPWLTAEEMRAELVRHFEERAKIEKPDWNWFDLHAGLPV